MLEKQTLAILAQALHTLDAGFETLPPFQPNVDAAGITQVLDEVARRMQDNYPYPHPMYAGQMLKPPHPVARLAYALAMYINPNNHALDGGRASSQMEKEAVQALADMLGWSNHLGHLTSGGTVANMEALWVAGCLHPGRKILASEQAHYTHARISGVLQLPYESVGVDSKGRMDMEQLRQRLKLGDVGTVVATLGTTGIGAVDPLPEILAIAQEHGVRAHVDSAYGGYFRLADNLDADTRAAYDALDHADSVVIDPHKHGLQPYGCGCVLFRDPSVGRFYRHDSPYTYFSSEDLHLGEISIECSRAGASAVALWATQKLLPLVKGGEFANGLSKSRAAALQLFRRMEEDPRYLTAMGPQLDIIIWAGRAESASAISEQAARHFELAAQKGLHLALIKLPADLLKPYWPDVEFDQQTVTCLRSCLMKPEHLDWLESIWSVLDGLP